ncbi:hypothetical protein C0J52_09982 [Blattella germanica]|nr:hypothetical protein C0J52_09982 [Blattella germanica]
MPRCAKAFKKVKKERSSRCKSKNYLGTCGNTASTSTCKGSASNQKIGDGISVEDAFKEPPLYVWYVIRISSQE